MINTQYINLNMIPSGVMPVLYCSQYDIGRPLGMVVYNGGEAVDLDSYTCTIEATRTDGTAIIAAVTTDGNIGAFVTTATMTNNADHYLAKLVLFDSNSRRVASLAFVMVVTANTMDENAEEIEEDASLYQQYTGTVQGIIAEIRADLAAEIANRKAGDAFLQTEIDQMIAPTGEAPSAAEVENARIGADGVTYTTLGNAIRIQDEALQRLAEYGCGQNLFTFVGSTADRYINEDGSIGTHTGSAYTAKFSVSLGTYVFRFDNLTTGSANWNCRIIGYDANDNYVRQINVTAVTSSTKYAVIFDIFENIAKIAISLYLPQDVKNPMLMRIYDVRYPSAIDSFARESVRDIREVDGAENYDLLYPSYDVSKINANTSISLSTKSTYAKANHCLTNGIGISPFYGADAVSIDMDGYYVRLHGFGSFTTTTPETYVSSTDFIPCDGRVISRKYDWCVFRCEFVKSDESAISSSDLNDLAEAIKIYYRNTEKALDRYADKNEQYDGLVSLRWKPGRINGTTGISEYDNSGFRIYTPRYYTVKPGETLFYQKDDASTYLNIYEYTDSFEFIKFASMTASSTHYTVSDTTAYVRFGYRNIADVPVTGDINAIIYRLSYINDNDIDTSIGLHTVPKSKGVLNAIKRARQLTDVKWTPHYDLPRCSMSTSDTYADHVYYFDTFKAGTEYVGVPYSQSGDPIGEYVPAGRFITSLSHPESAVNTLSVIDPSDHNKSTYYGAVCVDLVSYAFNIPRVKSASYQNVPGMTLKYAIVTNDVPHSLNDIELCDVLIHPTHVAIVTDVVKDGNTVKYIEVSEVTKAGNLNQDTVGGAYGGLARRKMWTVSEFTEWFKAFSLYSYDETKLESIPYDTDVYAPLTDEGDFYAPVDMPIIPLLGDRCIVDTTSSNSSIRTVKLLVNSTHYTKVLIKRNGVAYGNLLDITVDGDSRYVTLTHTQNDEAIFTAQLVNVSNGSVTNTSYPCTWLTFAHPTRSIGVDGNELTIITRRQSNLIDPYYVSFGADSSGTGSINGKYSMVTNVMVSETQSGYVYTFTVPIPDGLGDNISCVLVNKADGFGIIRSATFYIIKTASGAIASFTDGADDTPMRSVKVTLEPIQDLHGQDAPYPAGGGKNLIPYPYYSQAGTFDGITYTVGTDGKLTANGTSTTGTNFYFFRNMVFPAGTYTMSINGTLIGAHLRVYDTRDILASISPLETVRQKTFTIEEEKTLSLYLNIPNAEYEVDVSGYFQLELGSTATIYAPYSNICPISGRQSVTVTRTGVNLFDKSEVVDGAYINDDDGTERQSVDSKATGWISVVPGEKYYILTEQTLGAWGAWYDKDKVFIRSITGYLPSGGQKEQTAPSNAMYMRLTCYRSGSGNIDTFAVNHPSTDHEYHAYDGQQITIQLGQTVYGGTLDVTTGVLTVDRAMVDLGTLTWAANGVSEGRYEYATTISGKANGKTNMICSSMAVSETAELFAIRGRANSALVSSVSLETTIASFKTAMSGVQLCYELAQPITITLTPEQLTTVLGNNNVWSDGGDISVTYAVM